MMMQDYLDRSQACIAGTYNRFPIALISGEGVRVRDAAGKSYLDFVAGIAVCSLGHCHPAVAKAIADQARTLCHVSNLYVIARQVEYAERLVANSFADKVFFCNSGAEANEGAIKLARKFGNERLGGRYEIITMLQSFHGRTLATITATGQEKFQKGFEPLPPGFRYVPYNDLAALRAAVTEKTCAVLLEPLQAEGGVIVPDADYLRGVRSLCDETGILMMLDEVQTGMGRTGRLFAYEHAGICPDVMTLAKAMGNGFPIGALLATDDAMSVLAPGTHASTFGGNPLAMAAADATLKVMLEENIPTHCRNMGLYFMERLRRLGETFPVIRDVRGEGLLLGVELDREAAPVIAACLDKGLLIASAGPRVLRFVPPLVVTQGDIDEAIAILEEVLQG